MIACLFQIRIVAAICVMSLWGMSMSACATVFTWKEEVLLHDKHKIIVERSDTYDSSIPHEIGQGAPLAEHTTTFAIPGANRTVIWKSDHRPLSDTDGYYLLALDFLDGVPYVATRPAKCLTYNKWDRPNPPYVFFKFAGEWKNIHPQEFPEQFKINVIVTSRKKDNPKIFEANNKFGFVPAQTVAALNKEPGRPVEFYRIFSEPIDLFGICPEPTGADGLPIRKQPKH
jgi:hypothetical protein